MKSSAPEHRAGHVSSSLAAYSIRQSSYTPNGKEKQARTRPEARTLHEVRKKLVLLGNSIVLRKHMIARVLEDERGLDLSDLLSSRERVDGEIP